MHTGAPLFLFCISLLHSTAAQGTQPTSYAPIVGQCPDSTQLLRLAGAVASNNQTLNAQEAAYIAQRKSVALGSWTSWLGTRATGYDFAALVTSAENLPTLGVAISGGGFRAALYGASVLNALDGQNSTSTAAGTGGVLQMATYLTGLSGGSWVLGSYAVNNQPEIYSMVNGWILERNLLLPDGLISFGDNSDFYDNIRADVDLKSAAGFNTSITDLWGRAVSYHFAPGTTRDNFYDRPDATAHSAALLWDSIATTSNYQAHNLPFPIVVANEQIEGRDPGGNPLEVSPVALDHPVYEFSPYEFGSYDPYLGAFVNISYLGTHLNAGTPDNSTACVTGFQNFGYVIGTSSSLFNAIVNTINTANTEESIFQQGLQVVLQILGQPLSENDNDVANYPNPFRGLNPGVFETSSLRQLQIVDGGENGENVPLNPLLAAARGVDTIIAADSSADTEFYWPNGTSLIATSRRSQLALLNETNRFPPIPDADVFVSNGYNTRPTFFGCQASSPDDYPFVVYIANAPAPGVQGYSTNTSTFKLDYDLEEQVGFLNSASETVYKGFEADGQDRDSAWPDCLACALLERTRQRQGVARTSQCTTCFDRYCYTE